MAEFLVVEVVFPDLEGSLHIFFAVLHLDIPNGLQRLVLRAVDFIGVLLSVSPFVEHLGQQVLAHEAVAEILLLHKHLYRLESSLVPLFDRNVQSKLSKFLQCCYELLKSVVALDVKFAVLEKFIHRFLLAALEHLFQETERNLGDEEFVVVSVVTVHLGSLT